MAQIYVEQSLPILLGFLVFSVFLHQRQLRKAHQTLISPTEWLIDGGIPRTSNSQPGFSGLHTLLCLCQDQQRTLDSHDNWQQLRCQNYSWRVPHRILPVRLPVPDPTIQANKSIHPQQQLEPHYIQISIWTYNISVTQIPLHYCIQILCFTSNSSHVMQVKLAVWQ